MLIGRARYHSGARIDQSSVGLSSHRSSSLFLSPTLCLCLSPCICSLPLSLFLSPAHLLVSSPRSPSYLDTTDATSCPFFNFFLFSRAAFVSPRRRRRYSTLVAACVLPSRDPRNLPPRPIMRWRDRRWDYWEQIGRFVGVRFFFLSPSVPCVSLSGIYY